ncbi:MAG: NAD(P)-dependent alcohol dehydrogenase [Acidimicrobiales bacterium]
MQAIVQTSYGNAEVLTMGTIGQPQIADNEVLVDVRAAGLDRGTWHLMTGQPYLIRLGFGLRRPRNPVPGLDLAGVVAAVGADVTRFEVGDEVYGIGKGTLAPFAAAREDKLARKPANLTYEQAAVVAVSALTALQGLRDHARVEAGQRVLIIGASGGVGTYAVQIAKAMGAEVTGVASAGKLELVRSIGADHVIDYATTDFATGQPDYDVIFDIGGNATLSRLRSALAPKGTLVIVGGEEGGKWIGGIDRQIRATLLSPFVGQRMKTFVSKETAVDLDELTKLLASGAVTPVVGQTYPLAEAAHAMGQLEDGLVRGKVAITI